MRIEHKELLYKYSELKIKIKALEEEADLLNPQVLDIMNENEVEEVPVGDIGKLSLGSRRTWKYTPDTLEAEKKVKELKKFEEQTGTASYTEKKFVRFAGLNEKEE